MQKEKYKMYIWKKNMYIQYGRWYVWDGIKYYHQLYNSENYHVVIAMYYGKKNVWWKKWHLWLMKKWHFLGHISENQKMDTLLQISALYIPRVDKSLAHDAVTVMKMSQFCCHCYKILFFSVWLLFVFLHEITKTAI